MMIQKVAVLAYICENHCGPQDAYEQENSSGNKNSVLGHPNETMKDKSVEV